MSADPKHENLHPYGFLQHVNLKVLISLAVPFLILRHISSNSGALTHFLMEGWCIIVAMALFIFIRKSENFYHNYYLLLLSYVYLGAAIIDIYHVMVFFHHTLGDDHSRHLYDQYWTASRSVESIGVLTAFYFSEKKIFRNFIKLQYPVAAVTLIVLISSRVLVFDIDHQLRDLMLLFSNGVFFILFVFAAILLMKKESKDDPVIYKTIAVSFLFSASGELLFLLEGSLLFHLLAHYCRTLSYFFLFNGVVIEGMVAPFRRLKDTEKALRKEQLLYSQTLAAVKDGMIRVFPDKKEMDVSQLWEDMTGYHFDRHRLSFSQIAALIHPDDLPDVILSYRRLLKQSAPFKKEFRVLHSDGKWFWVLVRGKMFNSFESGRYFMGMMTDISWKKIIEKELIQAKEKAEEADRLKSAFLANISHEIRTPLNVILGFSNLLIKDVNPDESDEKKVYVKLISQSSDQLISIISDIIDISRIQNNQIQLHVQKIYLADFLNNLFTVYRKLMDDQGKTHIRLCWKVPDNFRKSLVLLADLDRFHQIWQNLLNNAMKFTEYGQITFGIEKLEEASVVFFVKDTGPGIPPGKESIIFDRFRQGQEGFSRQYRGSGLGLAITKELLHLMNGNIIVDQSDKVGASFLFTMPGALILYE